MYKRVRKLNNQRCGGGDNKGEQYRTQDQSGGRKVASSRWLESSVVSGTRTAWSSLCPGERGNRVANYYLEMYLNSHQKLYRNSRNIMVFGELRNNVHKKISAQLSCLGAKICRQGT